MMPAATLMSVHAAADRLGMSEAQVRALERSGDLPAATVHRVLGAFFTEAAVERYRTRYLRGDPVWDGRALNRDGRAESLNPFPRERSEQ